MTTFEDIVQIVAAGESEIIEFKATTGQRVEAARTLSAMLNGRGGQVLFGMQPNGKVTGQQVADKTLRDVTQACSDIHPWHPPTVDRVGVPNGAGREVLVVTVPSGTQKPYSHKGRYYVRSGSSTVNMPDETQVSLVLERAHGLDRWELADSQRDLDAIDEDEVRAFRDEAIAAQRANFDANASVEEVLRAMNLLSSDGKPNRGAIALFGHVDAFAGQFPTLGCRLVAVAGNELGQEFRDNVLVEANTFVAIRRAMSFCAEHLHSPVRIRGTLQAETGSEIPLEVVREALANAFGHRDYSVAGLIQVRVFYDRLEVWSPGGLHFGLTPADLYKPHSSHPWNPNIAGCLYRRGIIDQLGSGTLRMVRTCSEVGLGRPVFTAGGASVTCTVPRIGYWLAPNGSNMALGEIEMALLTALAEGPASRGQLAARLGTTSEEAREVLVRLHDLDLVHVKGYGRGSSWMLKGN